VGEGLRRSRLRLTATPEDPFSRAVYRTPDRVEAERRLEARLAAVDRAGLPAIDAFAKGIRLWREELLAFDEPTTEGCKGRGRRRQSSDRLRSDARSLGVDHNDRPRYGRRCLSRPDGSPGWTRTRATDKAVGQEPSGQSHQDWAPTPKSGPSTAAVRNRTQHLRTTGARSDPL
jgi:hypothetical protein